MSSKDSSSSGNRGNTPNGRKRKLSSRSHPSNSLRNSSVNNTRTISSYSVKGKGRGKCKTNTPKTKRGRYSTSEESPSIYSGEPSTSTSYNSPTVDEYSSNTSSNSQSSLELESDMAQSPIQSTNKQSPFGNNFVKGSGVNHKRPGQGKKLVIKNRKGNMRISGTIHKS